MVGIEHLEILNDLAVDRDAVLAEGEVVEVHQIPLAAGELDVEVVRAGDLGNADREVIPCAKAASSLKPHLRKGRREIVEIQLHHAGIAGYTSRKGLRTVLEIELLIHDIIAVLNETDILRTGRIGGILGQDAFLCREVLRLDLLKCRTCRRRRTGRRQRHNALREGVDGQVIDVILNVHVAVTSIVPGVVGRVTRIQSTSFLPLVIHTVVVLVDDGFLEDGVRVGIGHAALNAVFVQIADRPVIRSRTGAGTGAVLDIGSTLLVDGSSLRRRNAVASEADHVVIGSRCALAGQRRGNILAVDRDGEVLIHTGGGFVLVAVVANGRPVGILGIAHAHILIQDAVAGEVQLEILVVRNRRIMESADRRFAGFERIVDVIDMTDGAIGCLVAPVIDNIVREVRRILIGDLATEITGHAMQDQVVIPCKIRASEHDTKAVDTLVMTAPRIGRTNDRVLHRVIVVLGIQTPLLIRRPAEGAVIDNGIRAIRTAPGVVAGAGRIIGTRTGADIPHDDIIAAHTELVILERNAAAARCCLTCDSHIALADHSAFELDRTADIKHDDTSGFRYRIPEGALAAVVEICNVIHRAASAAGGVLAAAHSARKCQQLSGCLRILCREEYQAGERRHGCCQSRCPSFPSLFHREHPFSV